MNKFQDTYDHPKLNQEDINQLNRSITCNEIEAVIKTLPKKKSHRTDGFSAEFYQTFREELIPTLLKLFHEIGREETLLNSFYKANVTLIPKPDKDTFTCLLVFCIIFFGGVPINVFCFNCHVCFWLLSCSNSSYILDISSLPYILLENILSHTIYLICIYSIRQWSSFTLLHVDIQFSHHDLLKRLSFVQSFILMPLWKLTDYVSKILSLSYQFHSIVLYCLHVGTVLF
jgi:hypothetical protein